MRLLPRLRPQLLWQCPVAFRGGRLIGHVRIPLDMTPEEAEYACGILRAIGAAQRPAPMFGPIPARATRAGATAASDTPAPTPTESAPGSPVGPVGREG